MGKANQGNKKYTSRFEMTLPLQGMNQILTGPGIFQLGFTFFDWRQI